MSSDFADTRRSRARSWSIALCAAVIGALAGFAAARRDAGAMPARSDVALQRAGGASAGEHGALSSLDDWLAKATSGAARRDPGVRRQLMESVARSPRLLREVIERYGRQPQRPARAMIRELVAAKPGPDLVASALALASSAEALARAAGFELLALLEPSSESYALSRRGVVSETDPDALAGALMVLRPPGLPSRAETREVLVRLVELSRHTDPLVRAHAVQGVAEWDRTAEHAAPIALQALSDGERVVRQAAVGAVMIGPLRSDGLKLALLRLLASPRDDAEVKAAALQALERFSLSDDELAGYRLAHSEVQRSTVARSTGAP